MVIGVVSIQQRHSLDYKVTHFMVDKTLRYWKRVRCVCKIMVALYSVFRLVLCSPEDASFNSICLDVLEGIEQLYLLMYFNIYRLETPFKGDCVKVLIQTSDCENLDLYFLKKVKQIAGYAVLSWFSVTKQSLGNGFDFPICSEMPTLPTGLKF